MKIRNSLPLIFLSAAILAAHPMGDNSVNHYSRLRPTPRGVELHYVLDFGEWQAKQLQKPPSELALEWAANLIVTSDGRSVSPALTNATADKQNRYSMDFILPVATGNLKYEDRNYPGVAGWKEIVIVPGEGVALTKASHAANDRSEALTKYFGDPPQNLRAIMEWAPGAQDKPPVITPIDTPAPKSEEAASQRDYLTTLLSNRNLTIPMMLTGILVAFGLGAVHAMSPGHGKTIVAAYLVGSRGTMKHAIFLGAMVTFTHTVSVFLLGLATLYLSKYVVPDKVYPILGAISGLSIVIIGLSLLIKRARGLAGHHHHHHHHDHNHDHDHDHHHGPGGHTHVIEGEITLGSLMALGASGGLVPCPSAMVLLLTSIAIGRVAFGLVLLTAFSLGLAIILMAIGCAVLYARHLLPDSTNVNKNPFLRYVPVASAAFITCVGVAMTAVSLGWKI